MTGITGSLTLDQLARLTGEPKKRLQLWHNLGLIGDGDGEFLPEDGARVRLIHDLLHHGLTADDMAKAARKPDSLFSRYLEDVSAASSHPSRTVEEAAKTVGMDAGLVRRLIDAGGIRQAGDGLAQEDIEFFRACRIALEAGYPEDALTQLLRVYADAMERVAEAEVRTTHFYLHGRLKAEGRSGQDFSHAAATAVNRLTQLAEPAVLYFHSKGADRAAWDDMLTHIQEEFGVQEKAAAPGQIRRAVMFVDLANFTPLAEAMGDARAADVLERFALIVRSANVRCHGRVVKQIGDSFMIVFPESVSAVSCALEIEERAGRESQFPPVRAGLHWGSILYREGDYVGSNVNLASRLASDAKRHQVLVTGEVRRKAKALPGVEFVHLGKRKLKGLRREVEVFDVRPQDRKDRQIEIDPVCGIELAPAEVAARLAQEGRDFAFCSGSCLRKFVVEPEKYTS